MANNIVLDWAATAVSSGSTRLAKVFILVFGFERVNKQLVCYIPLLCKKKGEKKVQGVPQSQTAALPRHQEEEETDETKQAQIEQTYEKH